MSYPFVQAYHDLGRASGPRLAFVVHMAEGGGTVGFLSRKNRHGVSVHYVIEYTGLIVQMLREDHMHSSIRTSALRTSDDADGLYGRSAAVAVMGGWADTRTTLGPNHASIAVEIEGFAATGPNAKQRESLRALVADVRTRYPDIGLLGHRDFADYKACPGTLIPWSTLGGHGKGTSDVRFATVIRGKQLPVKAGAKWKYLDGSAGGVFGSDALVDVAGKADAHNGEWVVTINTGNPYSDLSPRPTLVLVESSAGLVDAPALDCSQAVADAKAAQHELTRTAAIKAVEAL